MKKSTIKVIGKSLFADRWVYSKPHFPPDEGKKVFISKCSFGPLEVYEWGLDEIGKPFRRYQWCEFDPFEIVNEITIEELRQKIQAMINLVTEHAIYDWAALYEEILKTLEKDMQR